jgi:hypothetical protein
MGDYPSAVRLIIQIDKKAISPALGIGTLASRLYIPDYLIQINPGENNHETIRNNFWRYQCNSAGDCRAALFQGAKFSHYL